jgi:hypothetical protein
MKDPVAERRASKFESVLITQGIVFVEHRQYRHRQGLRVKEWR